MEKHNHMALAYLLVGISAAGRALLAMPETTQLQELSLTVLAVVGYLLVARPHRAAPGVRGGADRAGTDPLRQPERRGLGMASAAAAFG